MQEEIRVFSTPAQQNKYANFPQAKILSILWGTPLQTDQSHSATLTHRHAFTNITKIDTVYNAKNRLCQCIYDALTTVKNRVI